MQPVDIVLGIIGLLCIVGILVLVPRLFIIIPFIPTSLPVVEKMIALADLKGNEVVYDLGAGDARILIEAKKKFPAITAKGCELAPMVWLWARVKIFFSKQDVQLDLGSALKMDVSDADCIFLYLFPEYLERIAKKFDAELKPGTKVISHEFAMKGRTPKKMIELDWKKRKKPIYLYEW